MANRKNALKVSSWWLVVRDGDRNLFSISGPINDDTPYNELVTTLQKGGRNVTIQTIDATKNRAVLIKEVETSLKCKYTESDLLREMS